MESGLPSAAFFLFLLLALSRGDFSSNDNRGGEAERLKHARNADATIGTPHCLYVTNSANSKLQVVDVNTKSLYSFLSDNGQVQLGLSVGKNPTGIDFYCCTNTPLAAFLQTSLSLSLASPPSKLSCNPPPPPTKPLCRPATAGELPLCEL